MIIIPKDVLIKLYFIKKLSLKQISKILNFSVTTIERRLKEYGFKLRDKFEAKKLINQSGKNNHFYKDGRTLKKYYCSCGNEMKYDSIRKGYKQCKECYLKIVGYFNKGKIRSKETRKKYSIIKGGTGIPYEYAEYNKIIFNNSLKEQIRIRDNYTCQNCNKSEIQEIKEINQKLTIHHIDYNKQNCSKKNLITVCKKCNLLANFNRDYWKKIYLSKIINF